MTAPDRLSQIETLWSMVYEAHGEADERRLKAQRELLVRYGGSIQRYLKGAFRDPVAAEDAYQEFAVKFLRGDFRSACQEKGRFRSFLKTILSRLVADHFRRLQRRPAAQLDSRVDVLDTTEQAEREQAFQSEWRDELLTHAWQKLAAEQQQSGKPWLQVLQMRVEQPEWRSSELAEALAQRLGEPVTANRVRVLLHRAREKFSQHLMAAVAQTLPEDSLEAIEEELAELELLPYCQMLLDRKKAEVANESQVDGQDAATPPQTGNNQSQDDQQ